MKGFTSYDHPYKQTKRDYYFIYIDGDIDVQEERPVKKGKKPVKKGKKPSKKGKRRTRCDKIKRSESCCGDRRTVGKTCRKVKNITFLFLITGWYVFNDFLLQGGMCVRFGNGRSRCVKGKIYSFHQETQNRS